ncbi:MAG: GlsB/YeaQ/YmgE family stress response membrane protein [Neisseria sp.]|nr:GlsB/YeaQ/YmgE family stress response membrane protein [Neisseria sp.]
MGILSWIVLGGLAGWVASIIMKTNAQMGIILNVVVGIIGAFLGGFITSNVLGLNITGFNIQSFLIALLGAVVLIFLVKLFRGKK